MSMIPNDARSRPLAKPKTSLATISSVCAWTRLSRIVERTDYGFTASADFSRKGPRFLRITDIQNGRVDWSRVPGCSISERDATANLLLDGDIVFARTGATTGKSLLIRNPPSAVCASYLIRLRPSAVVCPEYLSLFFKSDGYWNQIHGQVRGGAQPNFNAKMLGDLTVPLLSLPTQRHIATHLNEQLAEVDHARTALQAQLDMADALVAATLRESLTHGGTVTSRIAACLDEVTQGVGQNWREYPVLGATRGGLAPAKEPVGKTPERYKPVRRGTIFYNPMRILLGSIAMVDEGDAPGITSPDYVVMTARDGVLHPRWFYQWFRSDDGAAFVRSLTRGAVRERLLFKRLAPAGIRLPPWPVQAHAAEIMLRANEFRKLTLSRFATLDRLPAALLRQAFGDPPQVQDPNP